MTSYRTSCGRWWLPAPPRPTYGGRHRTISDRACLAAIVLDGVHEIGQAWWKP
jgi:hypothetical protein